MWEISIYCHTVSVCKILHLFGPVPNHPEQKESAATKLYSEESKEVNEIPFRSITGLMSNGKSQHFSKELWNHFIH